MIVVYMHRKSMLLMLPFGNIYHLNLTNSVSTYWPKCVPTYCPHIGQHVLILDIHLSDHLELFCKDRIRNINTLEVFLSLFNEDTSFLVYILVLAFPLIILKGYNTWIWWIRWPVPIYMNTLLYPLNLVGWQGSQVTNYDQDLAGTLNNASLNLIAGQVESTVFANKDLIIL